MKKKLCSHFSLSSSLGRSISMAGGTLSFAGAPFSTRPTELTNGQRDFCSSPIIQVDWPSATQTLIAAASTIGSGVAWNWNRRRRLKKTFVENVQDFMDKPFVPPLSPKYGPVFRRPHWEEKFVQMCDSDVYMLYHGPSQAGISLAVVQALKGRKGVAYLNLRGAQPEKVAERLAEAIGYSGQEIPSGSHVVLEMDTLINVLRGAATRLIEKNIKPVLIIEDIHSSDLPSARLPATTSTMVCGLVDLHIAGLVNTIYTTSDFNAISSLTAESGHSRLKPVLFPRILDEELLEELTRLAMAEDNVESYKHESSDQEKTQLQKQTRQFTFIERSWQEVTKKSAEGFRFVMRSPDDAEKIVCKLGGHMGDLTSCLHRVIEEGKTIDHAIEKIVDEQVVRFYTAFPEDVQMQKPSIVVAADQVLRALAHQPNSEEEIKWATVYDTVTLVMPFCDLVAAVNHLVRRNLVSYTDPETICFHSRALKWAYHQLAQRDTWRRIVSSALQECKKRTEQGGGAPTNK